MHCSAMTDSILLKYVYIGTIVAWPLWHSHYIYRNANYTGEKWVRGFLQNFLQKSVISADAKKNVVEKKVCISILTVIALQSEDIQQENLLHTNCLGQTGMCVFYKQGLKKI